MVREEVDACFPTISLHSKHLISLLIYVSPGSVHETVRQPGITASIYVTAHVSGRAVACMYNTQFSSIY